MAKLTVFVELTMTCAAPPMVTALLANLLEGHMYATSTEENDVSDEMLGARVVKGATS